jgi:hypothetical protein
MAKPFTKIAALLFALAALIHIVRLFTNFQVTFGNHTIPLWCSYIAIVVALLLAWGLHKESRT